MTQFEAATYLITGWLLIALVIKTATVVFDWGVAKTAKVLAQHTGETDHELLQDTIKATTLAFISLTIIGNFYF